ncbi:unnamed protein product [Cyprideis torosa]|uniref:NadR/Ttd14 AAA domain-containing protein n=1 Tax=Cyprideis torosa TaxID=163714 RepID=A0A7R8W4D2_9CRUS|nr:unnamed protein product [Cyprideis torosa]CAG0884078.1 unnamed protein product [Cyprideis torosa]
MEERRTKASLQNEFGEQRRSAPMELNTAPQRQIATTLFPFPSDGNLLIADSQGKQIKKNLLDPTGKTTLFCQPGLTLSQLATKLDQAKPTPQPNLRKVCIFVGGNDISTSRNQSKQDILDDVCTSLDLVLSRRKALACLAMAILHHITPPPPPPSSHHHKRPRLEEWSGVEEKGSTAQQFHELRSTPPDTLATSFFNLDWLSRRKALACLAMAILHHITPPPPPPSSHHHKRPRLEEWSLTSFFLRLLQMKTLMDKGSKQETDPDSQKRSLIPATISNGYPKDRNETASPHREDGRIVYRLVLTGGPCGGKTTGQSRLCTFFENLGWKVFRSPETSATLLNGGVKFADLSDDEKYRFQENLLLTMLQIETTFFDLACSSKKHCLVICDRGAMDASAYIDKKKWERIISTNRLNHQELRDSRYNQVIHMVTAAKGAEDFYSQDETYSRFESLAHARELDDKVAEAWVGHPYFDVVDNSTDFETKIMRMIHLVATRIGIDTGDRLKASAKKRKFLVRTMPPDSAFPPATQDFQVVHDFLRSGDRRVQVRLRKRGQKGAFNYLHTIRKPEVRGQVVEVRTQLTQRDYVHLLSQRSSQHTTVYKLRKCFLWKNHYFQLDMYRSPSHPRCVGLIFLETYTTRTSEELIGLLPDFLEIEKEVTGDPQYSMFNLSLREPWKNNKSFCRTLTVDDDDECDPTAPEPSTNGIPEDPVSAKKSSLDMAKKLGQSSSQADKKTVVKIGSATVQKRS